MRARKPTLRLRREIRKALEGTGYTFLAFVQNSVGVQGDARVVGPVVILRPPEESTTVEAGKVCTDLINRVKGVTRVLIDVPLTKS